MPKGPKRRERCVRGTHPMTENNRRVKLYIAADGLGRLVSAGCKACNAEQTKLNKAGVPKHERVIDSEAQEDAL